jgi:hypothetical protein
MIRLADAHLFLLTSGSVVSQRLIIEGWHRARTTSRGRRQTSSLPILQSPQAECEVVDAGEAGGLHGDLVA